MLNQLRHELNIFCSALMFYTRIPCPASFYSQEATGKSLKYFTLIGWIVGGLGAGTLYLLHWIFPLSVSLLLSIVATVLLTGAFHEDGFTDTCDAFGGGGSPEKILQIMKDSRIGAYGVIGIGLLLGIKFFTLYEIGLVSFPILLSAYINGHIASRFITATVVQTHEYVQSLDVSKSKSVTSMRLTAGEVMSSFLMMGAGWVLLILQDYRLLAAFPMAYLAKIYLAHYFKQHIGGYTGDCLGAIQQVSEVVFYLTILAFF